MTGTIGSVQFDQNPQGWWGNIPRVSEQLQNGQYKQPDKESGRARPELAGIVSELKGKSPQDVAEVVQEFMEKVVTIFNGVELSRLVNITTDAILTIGLEPNTDLTLIVREIQSRTMLFTQQATELLMKALTKIREVLQSNSDSDFVQDSNNPPFDFWGPNSPFNQKPQGPVLAA